MARPFRIRGRHGEFDLVPERARVTLATHAAARTFLREFVPDPQARADMRRRLLQEAAGSANLSEDEVVQQLAAHLVAGRYVAVQHADPRRESLLRRVRVELPQATQSAPKRRDEIEEEAFVLAAEVESIGGTKLVNQPVRVLDPDSGEVVIDRIETDDDGVVRTLVPENKTYRIEILEEEWETPYCPFESNEAQGTLACRFVDEGGAPIADTEVEARHDGHVLHLMTDSDGWILSPANHGHYELHIGDEVFHAHTVLPSDAERDPAAEGEEGEGAHEEIVHYQFVAAGAGDAAEDEDGEEDDYRLERDHSLLDVVDEALDTMGLADLARGALAALVDAASALSALPTAPPVPAAPLPNLSRPEMQNPGVPSPGVPSSGLPSSGLPGSEIPRPDCTAPQHARPRRPASQSSGDPVVTQTQKPKQKPKVAPGPTPPFEPTKLPGGVTRLFQICEDLRTRNTDGYLAGYGGILANIKSHGIVLVTRGTTCSPFTATVIGVAFDPTYPRNDWPNWEKEVVMAPDKAADPYVPMFNGGKDPMMPFNLFYGAANANDNAVNTIVKYNLGTKIDSKQMRRGDLIEINWWSGGGHAVFCWDVHLNDAGEVDAFQIFGSNGPYPGVSIGGCNAAPWLEGKNAAAAKRGSGSLKKSRDKIFTLDDETVRCGTWYGMPGVTKVDRTTFRVTKLRALVFSAKGANYGFTPKTVVCGRFHSDEPPPKPFCMTDGPPPPPPKSPPGHTPGPTTVVKGVQAKTDPYTPDRPAPKPVKQDKDKPTRWQLEVEEAMQDFWKAQWITTDPGKPDGINDAQTQAAVKDFQGKFHLEADGIAGTETRPVLRLQRPACLRQATVQEQLGRLFRGKKITSDPGPATGTNGPETQAAVKEFQGLVLLEETGIPDADTQAKLTEFLADHAPTAEKPGLEPLVQHLYWVGNAIAPLGTATLRLHSKDLIVGQACAIELHEEGSDTMIKAVLPILVMGTSAEASVPIPAEFGPGSRVMARVTADIADEGTLEANTAAPLYVKAASEQVDWRPFIGKGEIPQAICDAIAKNRARYPNKTIPPTGPKSKPGYRGPHKYDYKPPQAHAAWARAYFQKKVDAASPATLLRERAFVAMLDAEGRPASLQTYDNQIVTWGVGLGAKGDGVHAFEHLNKNPAMKQLLDGIGINYFGRDYHVVDLRTRKVVSSGPGPKGNDERHIVALEAWRQQMDLLSAIIGMSEDAATRVAVAESQYAVYLSNSTGWPGEDKIHTLALYFMIVHMFHWMPAIAKYGFDVEKEFQAIGGGTPSLATDKQIALRVARAFARKATSWFAKRPAVADDIRTRTKTRLWKKLKEQGQAEGFDPGEFSYED